MDVGSNAFLFLLPILQFQPPPCLIREPQQFLDGKEADIPLQMNFHSCQVAKNHQEDQWEEEEEGWFLSRVFRRKPRDDLLLIAAREREEIISSSPPPVGHSVWTSPIVDFMGPQGNVAEISGSGSQL